MILHCISNYTMSSFSILWQVATSLQYHNLLCLSVNQLLALDYLQYHECSIDTISIFYYFKGHGYTIFTQSVTFFVSHHNR